MATRGRRKVEVWKDEKNGIEIAIHLDSAAGTFHAEFSGVKMQEESLKAIRDRIAETVAAQFKMTWIPVIQVIAKRAEKNYRDADQGLTLNFRRFWLAKRANGEYTEVVWETPEKERVRIANDVRGSLRDQKLEPLFSGQAVSIPEYKYNHRSWAAKSDDEKEIERRVHLLPYREQMWNGLQALAERLEQVRRKLDDMLDSEQGRHLIATLGGNILPAPSDLHSESQEGSTSDGTAERRG